MNTKSIRSLALALTVLALSAPAFAQRTDGCSCGVPNQVPTSFLIRHSDPSAQQAALEAFNRWNLYVDIFRPTIGAPVAYDLGNGYNEILFYDFSQEPGIDPNSVVGYAPHLPDTAFGNFNACPMPFGASCGTFSEADVWLNHLVSWSVDRPNVDNPSDYGYYASTAVHEIGHTFGMHHNFKNISTMNYYQDYAGLYVSRADVLAVRKEFPNQTKSVFDLAIYPFTYDDSEQPSSHGNEALTPVNVDKTQVAQGGTIVVKNWTIENLSNSAQVGRIRFYLSADNNITTSDIDLGGLRWDPLTAWAEDTSGTALTIPSNVPSGNYYVGAIVGTGAAGTALSVDQIPYNNTFYVPTKITVGTVSNPSSCVASDTTLCLQNRRFSVTVSWNDGGSQGGVGHAVPFTDSTGFFWFSSNDNLEILLKVLNGCGINSRFWVFGAAATTLAYDITVTDTHTGQQVKKHHDNGSAAVAVTDINAFNTCNQ